MDKSTARIWAIVGALAAVAIAPLFKLTLGNYEAQVIWLAILTGTLWFATRLSRDEIGVVRGPLPALGVAMIYPVILMLALALLAKAHGASSLAATDLLNTALILAATVVLTTLVALIAIEGFFRGWLWAMLGRAGQSQRHILFWTSGLYALWQISVPLLEAEFSIAIGLYPVYLANMLLLGLTFGFLRLISGSVIVPSLAHGVWNGLAYILFGAGSQAGILGIDDFATFGPERGVFGVAVNFAAVLLLWRWAKREGKWGELQDA